MNEFSSLVIAVQLLERVAGRTDTRAMVCAVAKSGLRAIPDINDDLHSTLRKWLQQIGVCNSDGMPDPSRARDLIWSYEAVVSLRPNEPSDETFTAFTAPANLMNLSQDQTIEACVIDVVRYATRTLTVSSPYWNKGGLQRLNEVLIPAIYDRKVETTVLLHAADDAHDALVGWLRSIGKAPNVRLLEYRGTSGSLMHAKFVIADEQRGYLGSANLTSWGLTQHIEAGVRLTPVQCHEVSRFVDGLVEADAFSPVAA